MLTKTQLLGALEAHADNVRLAYAFRLLSRATDLHLLFNGAVAQHERHLAGFQPTLALLADRARLYHSIDQLHLAVVRTAVTEALDLTRDFCHGTSQTGVLKAQPWFHVFRMLRNALNHNFLIQFNKDDRKLLPVEWAGVRIDETLENTSVSLALLTVPTSLAWLEELESFVTNQLCETLEPNSPTTTRC